MSGNEDEGYIRYKGVTSVVCAISSEGYLAIGTPSYGGDNEVNSGRVKVYTYEGQWNQLGGDIYGESAGDQSGFSISLSSNEMIIAIRAPYNHNGYVRVYALEGTNWIQRGGDLNGESVHDGFGSSVSLSSNGMIIAIGAKKYI